MTKATDRLNALQSANERLTAVLSQREIGMMSWWMALNDSLQALMREAHEIGVVRTLSDDERADLHEEIATVTTAAPEIMEILEKGGLI